MMLKLGYCLDGIPTGKLPFNCLDELPILGLFLLSFLPHYHLVPLYPTPPSNHHNIFHAHESFFLFAQFLQSPNLLPALAVICSPSMSLSLFCLLVQLVHQIPHMRKIIFFSSFSDWLISLQVHPYRHRRFNFLPFWG